MEPARWLVDHEHLVPASGTALDVASGRGRHALWLAAHGLQTHAIDRDAEAIQWLREEAHRRGLEVRADVVDLEGEDPVIAASTYDVVVAVHYLHRALFPRLKEALRPGGLLIYETFTDAQAVRGKPTNPAFLLRPGELRDLVQPLQIVVEREGDFEGKMLASVIARRLS